MRSHLPPATPRRSTALIVVGTVLLLGPSLVSAVVAPDVDGGAAAANPPGEVLISYEGRPDGRVARYDRALVERWRHDDARSYLAVQSLPGGRVFYTWKRIRRSDCGPFPAPCAHTGFSVYDTDSDEVVRRWRIPVRTGANSEIHDAEVLDGGRVLLADMDRERVLLLNRDDEVVWQWNASAFYEPPADPTRTDWLHINDVDRIGDGRYLISVRNANQLLVIERGRGVVEVINEDTGGSDATCAGSNRLVGGGDGDVRCGDPSLLFGQHNPHWLGDGTVLVADSLNDRIVELRRGSDGAWRPVWTLSAAAKVPLDWPRDADRLPNGNTLVTDSRNNRVFAVDAGGAVVWSARAPGLPYEADVAPYGERRGMGAYGPRAATPTRAAGRIAGGAARGLPLVGRLRNGLTHVAPVPYWFGDGHLLGALAGLLAVSLGVGLRVRSRLAGS